MYKTNVSPILRIPFRRRSCTRRTVVSPRRREDPSADTKTNHLIPKNRIHHTQRPTPRDTCRFSTVVVRLTCNQKVSSSILEVVSSLSHIPNERERVVLTHHTHYRADKEFPPLHFCLSYFSLTFSFSKCYIDIRIREVKVLCESNDVDITRSSTVDGIVLLS